VFLAAAQAPEDPSHRLGGLRLQAWYPGAVGVQSDYDGSVPETVRYDFRVNIFLEHSNDFKQLDAALLSDEEAGALRRHLGGSRNSFDRSLLNAALARQNPKDAA
jgi:hypothetical protein